MSKAKEDSNKHQVVTSKPPQQAFSKFGKGPSFGFTNYKTPKAQFKPPAPRITQNKGGGGK
jgi:hypothetical protein